MGFLAETDPTRAACVDCYWQADLPQDREQIVYPSLPEPYVNLFFPVGQPDAARVKGFSSRADFMEMTSPLFGVRLRARAWIHLAAGPWAQISGHTVPLHAMAPSPLTVLPDLLQRAHSFPDRVAAFQSHWDAHAAETHDNALLKTAGAAEFVIRHFRKPDVVRQYASEQGVSPRTVTRWFDRHVGLTPKLLARVARFHAALVSLHAKTEPGFFLECGYFDQAHFIREFKEFTSIPPETYLAMLPR